MFELGGKRIWVAGHRGMVGSALVRRLAREDCDVVTVGRETVDLTRRSQVEAFLDHARPDAVVVAAAKVGGILANATSPADFLDDNLAIATNVIRATHLCGCDRLLFLGSSCIYPKWAEQPIREDALLTGALEPTNQGYALAKIAGVKLAQAYRHQYGRDYVSAMPTNLYGPGDRFDTSRGHVLPALIRKAHEAKMGNDPFMTVWGTGTPRREFLHVDDCADALVFLLKHYSADEHINVGSGTDIAIADLARLVCAIVGYKGELVQDTSKPDGTMRKLMSSTKLRELGWAPVIGLEAGIAETYRWYVNEGAGSRAA